MVVLVAPLVVLAVAPGWCTCTKSEIVSEVVQWGQWRVQSGMWPWISRVWDPSLLGLAYSISLDFTHESPITNPRRMITANSEPESPTTSHSLIQNPRSLIRRRRMAPPMITTESVYESSPWSRPSHRSSVARLTVGSSCDRICVSKWPSITQRDAMWRNVTQCDATLV